MDQNLTVDQPIFQQIAEKVKSGIMEGSIQENERIPSTNEFARFYQINPATAAKGINLLVDEGVIYKKRGIGMFVTEGAKDVIIQKRRTDFFHDYIVPLKEEASKLGISIHELKQLLEKEDIR
ncbi:GntR family transcriptional regulator [Pontibacillus halophilus JSM 076056 = DSM 19796]|uniref:GntR family transcriptional regulator n=1 Tax=Pontibacillus halophilus JSM 076056 = DSM 19796 TaxID=1385510 RepID=A0A0A5GIR7_9BACI|nr:GntR family transcriptional regulator [Pontibacillus halophilus]KGX91914.1 GntR family transcriptional regulator [Pontibacillus halophilus JSM 076056 = DSM 19796]